MQNLYDVIKSECSSFINESNGYPLIKNLKSDNRYVRKVKVRTKKNSEGFIQKFNEAFNKEHNNIYGRSIFCNGKHNYLKNDNELVYVFPINGFKFLFNPNIEYHMEYSKAFEKVEDKMTALEAENLLIDMIEYSYNSCNYALHEALFSEKEIIIYNIPYYYAIKVSRHPHYNDLLQIFSKY